MARDFENRNIEFESIFNFRDLGGYRTQTGREIARKRIFRSGELRHMSRSDLTRLSEELKLAAVLDLRNSAEIERQGIGPLQEAGVRYNCVPLTTGKRTRSAELEFFRGFADMGEVYLSNIRNEGYCRGVVEAFEIIAQSDNHPLVFHCAAGKDRTGILAALLLSVLGVQDEDIVMDYTLSAPHMPRLKERLDRTDKDLDFVKNLPAYTWEARAESMRLFLSTLSRECGSPRGYLEAHGLGPSLIDRLEEALLT